MNAVDIVESRIDNIPHTFGRCHNHFDAIVPSDVRGKRRARRPSLHAQFASAGEVDDACEPLPKRRRR
jgi:hypothetical protein